MLKNNHKKIAKSPRNPRILCTRAIVEEYIPYIPTVNPGACYFIVITITVFETNQLILLVSFICDKIFYLHITFEQNSPSFQSTITKLLANHNLHTWPLGLVFIM